MNVFLPDCLRDQVALVTGASRGIGASISDQLARAGATVIGTATSQDGAEQITQRLAAANGQGRGAVLDVRDAAAADALIDAVGKEHGKLSILVNNAGITRDTLAMRMKDDDWSVVIDTNLSAVFRLSRAVLRGMMKARHGRIISITSVVGASGNAGQANYAAAKAGVTGMTRALARELGSRNITVNCIAPGFIETDMTRQLTDEQTRSLLAQVPLGRLGFVDEIGAAVVFLASAAGSYISGATIHVNGGMYMA
ncbi:MAG TPA: 3-oxoacyl-ACP reductase FabG [Burkholderiaceae bacterium]|nr:3-oxoacyl-ACP reductase FabG [Burkholderiaceae bacterium]